MKILGIGTDIGAGTTFNQLQTLNEAYKVMQLQGYKLSAFEAFYLATLGGAKSLSVDNLIGNFDVGKEADFVVLNPRATPLLARKADQARNLDELLFGMVILGDDRLVERTHIATQL